MANETPITDKEIKRGVSLYELNERIERVESSLEKLDGLLERIVYGDADNK